MKLQRMFYAENNWCFLNTLRFPYKHAEVLPMLNIGLKQKFVKFFNWCHLKTWFYFTHELKITAYNIFGKLIFRNILNVKCFYVESEYGRKWDVCSSFDAFLFTEKKNTIQAARRYVIYEDDPIAESNVCK